MPIDVINVYRKSHPEISKNITASQYNSFANDNNEVKGLDEIGKYLDNAAQEMVSPQVIAQEKMNNTRLNNSSEGMFTSMFNKDGKEYKVGGRRRKRRTCRKIRRKIRRRTKRKKRKSCKTRKKKHKRKSKRKNTRRKREKLVD